jgi:hypothetical protein
MKLTYEHSIPRVAKGGLLGAYLKFGWSHPSQIRREEFAELVAPGSIASVALIMDDDTNQAKDKKGDI